MSCRSASTSGSSPCSRSVALVTGPIETIRAPSAARPPAGLEEEAHGRGGGEGDVVGARARAASVAVVERLGDRLVERDDVDLGAALAQRVGQHVAGLGGARDERAASTGTSRERLDQRLGDRALGHDVGARSRARAAPRAVPGPIAATVAPASARASRPAARRRSNSRRTPFGLVRQTRSYARRASGASPAQRLDPDRRRLDHLGAERAQPRGEPARLRARARDRDACARAAAGARARRARSRSAGDRADHA